MLHHPLSQVPDWPLGTNNARPPCLCCRMVLTNGEPPAGDRREGRVRNPLPLLPHLWTHHCPPSGGHCEPAATFEPKSFFFFDPSLSSSQNPSSCPPCLQVPATVPSPPLKLGMTQEPQGHVTWAPLYSWSFPAPAHTFLKIPSHDPQAQQRCSKASVIAKCKSGTSLVVQRVRIRLPMQGTQVRSLVGELGSHMPRGNSIHKPQLERSVCSLPTHSSEDPACYN